MVAVWWEAGKRGWWKDLESEEEESFDKESLKYGWFVVIIQTNHETRGKILPKKHDLLLQNQIKTRTSIYTPQC